jgi:hypothetical protein
LLDDARRLAYRATQPPDRTIRLHPANVYNDVAAGWLTRRLNRVQTTLERLVAEDYSNSRWVGRRLRKRAARVVRQVNDLADLTSFLAHFEEDSVGVYWEWAVALAAGTDALFRNLTAESAADALDAGVELDELTDQLVSMREFFNEFDEWTTTGEGDPTLADVYEVAVGDRPEGNPAGSMT